MKQYINRVSITDDTTRIKWRVTHATNAEDGNDYMHAQDYTLSPAMAATLQAAGYVAGQVTLIDVTIDPVEVK